MPPLTGPQGPFAGITAGADGTLYVSADGDGSVLRAAPGIMTITPADHRYLQVARTLRKEIVDGVYPVGSQLPTEHELCERFAVSRYTVREALRRLRDDNLVSSRPRAGTIGGPAALGELGYAQDNMTIDDLLAFASGARSSTSSRRGWSRSTAERASRTGLPEGEQWLAGASASAGRWDAEYTHCWTEYYINRAFAGVGRLFQRHTRPDLSPHRGSVRRDRRRGIPGDRGGRRGDAGTGQAAQRGCRGWPAVEVHRTYKTSDGQIAQVTINTHPALRFRHSMTLRRVQGLTAR